MKGEWEVEGKFSQLQQEWKEKLVTIQELLELTTTLTSQEVDKWQLICRQLNHKITHN